MTETEKKSSFLPGKGMLYSSPVARGVGTVLGKSKSLREAAGRALGKSRDAARGLTGSQIAGRWGSKASKKAPKTRSGSRLGRRLLLGAGVLGGAGVGSGATAAAKERAMQPLAPPEQLPPGY